MKGSNVKKYYDEFREKAYALECKLHLDSLSEGKILALKIFVIIIFDLLILNQLSKAYIAAFDSGNSDVFFQKLITIFWGAFGSQEDGSVSLIDGFSVLSFVRLGVTTFVYTLFYMILDKIENIDTEDEIPLKILLIFLNAPILILIFFVFSKVISIQLFDQLIIYLANGGNLSSSLSAVMQCFQHFSLFTIFSLLFNLGKVLFSLVGCVLGIAALLYGIVGFLATLAMFVIILILSLIFMVIGAAIEIISYGFSDNPFSLFKSLGSMMNQGLKWIGINFSAELMISLDLWIASFFLSGVVSLCDSIRLFLLGRYSN